MRPADERLKTNDLAGGEVDFRLVVEDKLALIEGTAQILLARPALAGAYSGAGIAKPPHPLRGKCIAQSAQFQAGWQTISARLSSMRISSGAISPRGWRKKMVRIPRIFPSNERTGTAGKEDRAEQPWTAMPAPRFPDAWTIVETTTGPSSASTMSKMEFWRGSSRSGLAPGRLDPDSAFVGKADSRRIRLEVLRCEPGNGVETGFWLGVQNPGRNQGGKPGSFLLSDRCLPVSNSAWGMFTPARRSARRRGRRRRW